MSSPINLKQILSEISEQITATRRKTNTLIEYYISPGSVPSAISAYDPNLAILESRVKSISKISFLNLSKLLDHADGHGAIVLNEVIDDMLNAVHGLKTIFEERYDRQLEERKPFESIYQLLLFREDELKKFVMSDMQNLRFLRPENIRPSETIYFCKGAVQMINNRDLGKVKPVQNRDLSEANHNTIARFGGGYLWWECAHCSFRCRFHMVNSLSNIQNVDEMREYENLRIEYRSSFLAKSHLFNSRPVSERAQRRTSSFSGWGQSSSSSSWQARYGCMYCFAEGKLLDRDRTAFETPKELMEHLVEKHKSTLPPALLLQKLRVAVNGKSAEGVRRWDINFV